MTGCPTFMPKSSSLRNKVQSVSESPPLCRHILGNEHTHRHRHTDTDRHTHFLSGFIVCMYLLYSGHGTKRCTLLLLLFLLLLLLLLLLAFMHLYSICNLRFFCPIFFLIVCLIWYWNAKPTRPMVPASPNSICHCFTRAIPKGLTCGLCLYV